MEAAPDAAPAAPAAFGVVELAGGPAPAFIAPTSAGVALNGLAAEAVPRGTAAATAVGVVFGAETPAQAVAPAAPPPVFFGAATDPAGAADPGVVEVLPPPIEVTPAPPGAVAVEAPAATAAEPPAAVAPVAATEAPAEETRNWGWAAAAAVAAGGYWVARRYRAVQRLAAYLRRPALPARA